MPMKIMAWLQQQELAHGVTTLLQTLIIWVVLYYTGSGLWASIGLAAAMGVIMLLGRNPQLYMKKKEPK